MLEGTSVAVLRDHPTGIMAEPGLRFMAIQDRLTPRMLAEAMLGAIREAKGRKEDRFARVVVPGPSASVRDVVFVFLVLGYPVHLNLPGGYDQYRVARTHMLHAYCLAALFKNRDMKSAVGIAVDGVRNDRRGGSEDMLALNIEEWNDSLEREAVHVMERFDILRPGRVQMTQMSGDEYPQIGQRPSMERLSRQRRRALERERRKRNR